MEVRILTMEDFRVMPWRNGLGTTTELWVEPSRDGDPYLWRLSVAEIAASGPFSLFPGYDRLIVPLCGGLIKLHQGQGQIVELQHLQPHRFSGEMATSGELVGPPAKDFNVIFRKDLIEAEISIVTGEYSFIFDQLGDGATTALFLYEGTLTFDTEGLNQVIAAPALVLLSKGGGRFTCLSQGTCLRVDLCH